MGCCSANGPSVPLAGFELSNDVLERLDDFVRLDLALAETQSKVESLRRRAEREHIGLRPSCLRFGRLFTRRFARHGAMASQFLDQRYHFLRVGLSNYLKKRGLSANVGQPTEISDLVGHGRQRHRLGDGGSGLSKLPRQVLVRVTAPVGQLL